MEDTQTKGLFEVMFTYKKETDNCICLAAVSKDSKVFGSLYIRKEDFLAGCTDAFVTVQLKED